MGLHQTKNFYTAKEIINKVKRQLMEWEKIFANHISEESISTIYKKHIQPNTKQII